MLHDVEVTRLDAMDHGVELPGRAQRGVPRGRELDAVDHGVEPSTTNQQTPFANRGRISYFLLPSWLFLSKNRPRTLDSIFRP